MLHNARHKPLPRKPYPKPVRPRKRRWVTSIAGFQCFDGLLMCADSEETIFTESKSQVRKIDAFRVSHASVAIGGAGDTYLIEYVQLKLQQAMQEECPTWENVDPWLTEFVGNIWDTCIRPFRGLGERPHPEFLIGLRMFGTYSLYRWIENRIHEIPNRRHVSIGTGIAQSEPLLSDLQEFCFPVDQMLLYAVRAMLRVKQLVQGCGGKTEVVFLRNDGLIVRPATIHVDVIEYLVEEIDHFLLADTYRFISGHVQIDDTEDLRRQTETLKEFRTRYKNAIPSLMTASFP